MPKLSIITINLNNQNGLLDTFQSVFSQTFADFEYIVIDGASSDGSKELILQNREKFSFWASEPDIGIYHAMNKGITKAKGDYLLFLNSGDFLSDNDVLKNILCGEANDIDFLYGNLSRIFPSGKSDLFIVPDDINFKYLLDSVLPHPSTFINRSLFVKYGLYREDLKIVSDWAFTLKVFAQSTPSCKYKNITVSTFMMDGISSDEKNISLIFSEKEKIKKELSLSVTDNAQRLLLQKSRNYDIHKESFLKQAVLKSLSKLKRGLSIIKKISKMTFNKKSLYQILFPKKIPIIINSFNRYTYLKQLVDYLDANGYKNIIILDNNSTYQPLLDYYDSSSFQVIRLKENYGHLALWDSGMINSFKNGFFIYTDPDVLPMSDCSTSFIYRFLYILFRFPEYRKVGFGIKIDDLPDSFSAKSNVKLWESKFWSVPIGNDLYKAHIDTTFALYEPFYDVDPYSKDFYNALRTGGSLVVQHLPWYVDSSNLSIEDKYYVSTANESATWKNLANLEVHK